MTKASTFKTFATTGACALALTATTVDAAIVHFCWQGGNGYTMTGTMEFPDDLLNADMITEADLTRFKISGYLEGQLIGTWNLAQLTPTTSWALRYYPQMMVFPTTEGPLSGSYQEWNADGTATDCGPGGFGFNAGNYAQDFCLNGTWVEPSGVPPETPFVAQSVAPYRPDCTGPDLIG